MKRERFYIQRNNWLRKYKYASLLLLGFSITANAATYPFEGRWGWNKDDCIHGRAVEYTHQYMRNNLLHCGYVKVEQTTLHQWKIQATCEVPVSQENESGKTAWHTRTVDSLIELTIQDNRLTESLTRYSAQKTKEAITTEYYYCIKSVGEENSQHNKASQLFKQANQLRFYRELTGIQSIYQAYEIYLNYKEAYEAGYQEPKVLYEQAKALHFYGELVGLTTEQANEIYRLYQAAYDAGHPQAVGALALATMQSYNKSHYLEEPDWEKVFTLLEQGSKQGNAEALRGMAGMYRDGLGPLKHKRNIERAAQLYKQASDLGDHQATMLLGVLLTDQMPSLYLAINEPDLWHDAANDFAHLVDKPLGLELLKQAADAGNRSAWEMLANYYRAEKNPEQEEYYLREGAKKGNVRILQKTAIAYKRQDEPFAEDLSSEDKSRLANCFETLFLHAGLNNSGNLPIADLDKRCPRQLSEQNHVL